MVFTLIPESYVFCKGYARRGAIWIEYINEKGERKIMRFTRR